MSEQLKVIQDIRREIQGAKGDVENVAKSLVSLLQESRQLQGTFKFDSPQGAQNGLKANSAAIDELLAKNKKALIANAKLEAGYKKLSQQIKRQKEQIERLSNVRAKSNKLTLSERVLKQKLTAQLKLEYRASTDILGQYSKLNARFLSLQKRYQDLLAKKAQNVKLTKAEAAEFRKLSRQVPKMDKALKSIDKTVGRNQRNVGNYTKVWAGLGAVMRQVLFAFGAYSALEIGRTIFNQVKEVDELNKSLAKVTETQERFNAEQRFLVELSDEAGVELNRLQKAYTKFLASAKTTNLTIAQTRDIFRQTAKAGAVLGLSTDDINGAFRALEQILSKGKVQAEEIRGQLGERLPGAFQILAKSMGLTTAELSKQLELGNVISEEVLPGFARELEKVYGLDTINKVDNLTAAQNRLTNEWNLFIRDIESGEGKLSNSFKVIIESVAGMIKEFRKLFKEFGGAVDNTEQNIYVETLRRIKSDAEKTGKTIKELAEAEKKAAEEKKKAVEEELVLKQQRLALLKKETNAAERFAGISKNAKEFEDVKEQVKIQKLLIAGYDGRIRAAKELLSADKKNDDETKKGNETANKTIKIIEGSVAAYQKLISEIKRLRDNTATTSKEYNSYNSQIRAAEKAIDNLTESLGELHAAQEIASRSADLDIFPTTQTPGGRLHENITETEQTAERSIQEQWIEGLETARQYFDEVNSLSNAFYANRIQRIDDEIAAQELRYSQLLDNEELTLEQRAAIEAEAERKRQELEKKKREEQRKQAVVAKVFAATQVVNTTAQAVLAALAPPPVGLGPVNGIPFAVQAASLGAIQLATVLAQPIPQFKDGVENFAGGLAIVGDGGKQEPITDSSGQLIGLSPSTPTLLNLPKGSNVYPSVADPGFINHVIDMDLSNGSRSLNQAAQSQSAGIETAIKEALSKVTNPIIHNHQKGIDYSRLAKELSKINKLESI